MAQRTQSEHMWTIERRPVNQEITPRLWKAPAVAARLGVSLGTFNNRLKDLVESGFPARDPIFKSWDSVAIERWLTKSATI